MSGQFYRVALVSSIFWLRQFWDLSFSLHLPASASLLILTWASLLYLLLPKRRPLESRTWSDFTTEKLLGNAEKHSHMLIKFHEQTPQPFTLQTFWRFSHQTPELQAWCCNPRESQRSNKNSKFQNPAPLNPRRGLHCAEICGNFWQSAEIVGNCVSQKISEILPPTFSGPLKCRVRCRHPSALHSPRPHTSWKNNIASNFCKNPFAKYPFFQLLSNAELKLQTWPLTGSPIFSHSKCVRPRTAYTPSWNQPNATPWLCWGFFLRPQPPHTRQKYDQKYGPQTAEFALFWSIWRHILYRCLFIFLPCMWGAGVTSVFLICNSDQAKLIWNEGASLLESTLFPFIVLNWDPSAGRSSQQDKNKLSDQSKLQTVISKLCDYDILILTRSRCLINVRLPNLTNFSHSNDSNCSFQNFGKFRIFGNFSNLTFHLSHVQTFAKLIDEL